MAIQDPRLLKKGQLLAEAVQDRVHEEERDGAGLVVFIVMRVWRVNKAQRCCDFLYTHASTLHTAPMHAYGGMDIRCAAERLVIIDSKAHRGNLPE